jgi:hypothetical protein
MAVVRNASDMANRPHPDAINHRRPDDLEVDRSVHRDPDPINRKLLPLLLTHNRNDRKYPCVHGLVVRQTQRTVSSTSTSSTFRH